jgi:hypothetical protein
VIGLWLWGALAVAGDQPLPQTIALGGEELVLNGVARRKVLVFPQYLAALYLESPTRSSEAAVQSDLPKRMVLCALRRLPRERLVDDHRAAIQPIPAYRQLSGEVQQVYAWLTDLQPGEEVVFDYVPGVGTTVTVASEGHPPIGGAPLMRLIWAGWVGAHAAEALREELLYPEP